MVEFKTKNLDNWHIFGDGSRFEFENNTPTVLRVRAFGPTAVWLDFEGVEDATGEQVEDLLLGCGEGEFTVTLDAHYVPHRIRFSNQYGQTGAFEEVLKGHTQLPMADLEVFTVIREKNVQSDEVRMIQAMLRAQQVAFDRQLTEARAEAEGWRAMARETPNAVDASAGQAAGLGEDAEGEHTPGIPA